MKLTKAQKKMLHEAGTNGVVNRYDERRHKTFRFLVEEGLLEHVKDQGWGLSYEGGQLAKGLFPDDDIDVMGDPFHGERCGISDEAFAVALEYFDVCDNQQDVNERSRRDGRAETREHLIREHILSTLRIPPDSNGVSVEVKRCSFRCGTGGDVLNGFHISTSFEGYTNEEGKKNESFKLKRSSYISSRAELDSFVRILAISLKAITTVVDAKDSSLSKWTAYVMEFTP